MNKDKSDIIWHVCIKKENFAIGTMSIIAGNSSVSISFIVDDFKPEYCFEKCNYLYNLKRFVYI